MAEPYIGEIRIFGFNYAPRGWAVCNGQLMPIQQQTALYSVLGTRYGGDGRTNFALPYLAGRAPMNFGHGPGLTPREIGESGGSETVTLTESEIPAHTHDLQGRDDAGDSSDPNARIIARPARGGSLYSGGPAVTTMAPASVGPDGGAAPHNNMQPYLTMLFCIALNGVYPNRP